MVWTQNISHKLRIWAGDSEKKLFLLLLVPKCARRQEIAGFDVLKMILGTTNSCFKLCALDSTFWIHWILLDYEVSQNPKNPSIRNTLL